MGVAQVKTSSQGSWGELYDSPGRTAPFAGYVGACLNQYRVMKEIVGGSILLKDNDNMRDFSSLYRTAVATAAVRDQQNRRASEQ